MSIVLTHPTGNQNSRQAALALAEAELLTEMWTAISWRPDRALERLLPVGVRAELHRRSFPDSLAPFVRTKPFHEWARLIGMRLHLRRLVGHERAPFSIDSVFRQMDRHVAGSVLPRLRPRAVYAYEDGALETFRSAETLGVKRLYELPIGYWRAARVVFQEERERQPAWAVTLSGLADSEAKLARKDEELRLASEIVVPSSFVRDTLALAPSLRAPIRVVPYGAPNVSPATSVSGDREGPLKVLFVGSLGQRKGLSYLLEAVTMMGSAVDLTILGRKPSEECAPLNEAVKRYRWIPSAPHDVVLREMRQSDVLVFPSLFEGFALVILEAMSQGTPVIATHNSGATEAVADGQDGFIVPIRDPQAIAEKLELLHRDRDRLVAMSEAARKKAETLTWEAYRQGIAAIVREMLGETRTC